VAFSPDGTLLATADQDGRVQLWNPVTGHSITGPLSAGHGGSVWEVAFSPDGTLLATAGDNGTVQLLEVPLLTHPYGPLCADVGALTRQEWDPYASGEPFPRICA
jgi:WD40 repeat protein